MRSPHLFEIDDRRIFLKHAIVVSKNAKCDKFFLIQGIHDLISWIHFFGSQFYGAGKKKLLIFHNFFSISVFYFNFIQSISIQEFFVYFTISVKFAYFFMCNSRNPLQFFAVILSVIWVKKGWHSGWGFRSSQSKVRSYLQHFCWGNLWCSTLTLRILSIFLGKSLDLIETN